VWIFILLVWAASAGMLGAQAEPTLRLYEELGLTAGRTSTYEQIRAAYVRLRTELDPQAEGYSQRAVEARERLKRLGEAWNVLKDEHKRRHYDRYGDGRGLFIDFIDHKTIESVRAALGADGPWEGEGPIVKAVRYYMARPAAFVQILLLDPEYDFAGTAQYYDGPRAKEFEAFLRRLRTSLVAAYNHRGDGRSLLSSEVAEILAADMMPEREQIRETGEEYFSLGRNAEAASRVAAELQIYTPAIFEAVIANYFNLTSLESALKFIDPRILQNGAATMTPDVQRLLFDHLFNLEERTHPMLRAQIGQDSSRYNLVSTLFHALLKSPLSDLEVRSKMYGYMLHPRGQLSDLFAPQAQIASYFMLRGNPAEAAKAREILARSLYLPLQPSSWISVPSERLIAVLAFVAAGEPFTAQGLAAIAEFTVDPLLEGASRVSILESAMAYGIFSRPLLDYFERRKNDILPTVLPKRLQRIYKEEFHRKALEEERAGMLEMIDRYRVGVEAACNKMLGAG